MKIRTSADARALRLKMEKLSERITDLEAPSYSEFFPVWSASKGYSEGNRVQYNDSVYKYISSFSGVSLDTPDKDSNWVKLTGETNEET